jgi:hypothetical protein
MYLKTIPACFSVATALEVTSMQNQVSSIVSQALADFKKGKFERTLQKSLDTLPATRT